MLIQWFPGHMHKAQKEMRQLMPRIDVIIEVLDARMPFSSSNPLVDLIREDQPLVRLLNKEDLADPPLTQTWLTHLQRDYPGDHVQTINAREKSAVSGLPRLCRSLNRRPKKTAEDVRVLIMGIPNVGKSTLINSLAGRTVAKTGNEPAITRRQDAISIEPGFVLCDTPGILWPDLGHANVSMRLATLGSIRETVVDYVEAALFSCQYLFENYRQRLDGYCAEAADAYQQAQSDPHQADAAVMFIETFGQSRGTLQKRGQVDIERAARLFINEIRSGQLGQLTFETPQDALTESREIEQHLQKKEEKKNKRSKKK